MTTDEADGRLGPDPGRLTAARAALAAATVAAQARHDAQTGDAEHDGEPYTRVVARRRIGPAAMSADAGHAVEAAECASLRAGDTETVDEPTADGTAHGEGSGPSPAQTRQIALRQLAMGPRSRHQLTEKMTARGCHPQDIAIVLDRLTDVGLVDDAAYAEMLVRTKRDGSGLATSALRHELRKKGVSPDIAETALTAASADDERTRAEELVSVRLRRMAGLDREVQMRRLAGFLSRKGYPSGLALSVVRAAVDGLPEHERD